MEGAVAAGKETGGTGRGGGWPPAPAPPWQVGSVGVGSVLDGPEAEISM